jgi:transcription elongation factor GreB
MSDLPNYVTPEGFARLTGELEHLLHVERPRVVKEVQEAAAQGDRSENAEYIYGKRRLREIDRRMNYLGARLKNVVVVDPAQQRGDQVFFGALVDLEDEEGRTATYRIVGEDETEPSAGRISWKSPLGRALLKRRAGDTVTVPRPGGEPIEYTLLAVRYG